MNRPKKKRKQAEERLRQCIREFLETNPGLSYEDYMKHAEMVTTVGMLPSALFEKYRHSGMTVEEVYKLIKGKEN